VIAERYGGREQSVSSSSSSGGDAMTSIQEPFLDAMRQSQQAALTAFESWTKTVQQTFGQATSGATTGTVDPNEVVDQVFDFAEKMLETQRQFAKNLMAASVSAAEAVQRQSVGEGGGEGG
jgi:hypothetical protein